MFPNSDYKKCSRWLALGLHYEGNHISGSYHEDQPSKEFHSRWNPKFPHFTPTLPGKQFHVSTIPKFVDRGGNTITVRDSVPTQIIKGIGINNTQALNRRIKGGTGNQLKNLRSLFNIENEIRNLKITKSKSMLRKVGIEANGVSKHQGLKKETKEGLIEVFHKCGFVIEIVLHRNL